MKKQQLTDWFPADVKPVHVGVYKVKDSSFMWLWDGTVWRSTCHGQWVCQGQHKIWRGLANPPKEAKQKGEK